MNAALAAAATLVAVGFALSTLDRWLRRRRPHDLAWSVSLALFAVGAGALWWAETAGLEPGKFPPLLSRRRRVERAVARARNRLSAGRPSRSATGCGGGWCCSVGFSAGVVLFAPTRRGVAGKELPTGKDVFGVAPRVLAAVGSGIAAVVIIAGALWSVVPPRCAGASRPCRVCVAARRRRVSSSSATC